MRQRNVTFGCDCRYSADADRTVTWGGSNPLIPTNAMKRSPTAVHGGGLVGSSLAFFEPDLEQ
jgi:hypothetical protein